MKNSRHIYKKHFISEVICRLDFSDKQKEEVLIDNNALFEKVSSLFPIKEKDQLIEAKEIRVSKVETTLRDRATLQKTYMDKSKSNKCVFSNMFFLLDYKLHPGFDEIKETLTSLLTPIFNANNKLGISRIGLRYINTYSKENIAFRKLYFSKPISSAHDFISSKLDSLEVTRVINKVEYLMNEIKINFRYGFFNKNYPSVLIGKDFVLDFDAIYNGYCSDIEEVINHISVGHDGILELFENSITQNLKDVMDNG